MRFKGIAVLLLNQVPIILFLAVFVTLGCMSDRFLELQNLTNILIQSSSLAVAAIGMTFVLLTAGVDLSVGSVMFVAVAVSGKFIFHGYPLSLGMMAGLLAGLLVGAINGLLVVRLRVAAFIATLAMLFIVRGFGLWLTNTRAMNMPESVTLFGASNFLGVPTPVLAMLCVALSAHVFLAATAWGRQIYAIGFDREAARKAGVQVSALLMLSYVICGLCAALAGLIALSQTGAVSPTFGSQREFAAIAAAVLGGTSLFGGRGNILPGTLFGSILFQTVENGLVILNADPYLYPIIVSVIIFFAVLLDTTRNQLVSRLTRRTIRSKFE
ncbi:MAG: ABC transporter permease [Pirellula sp.]